jgi:glycerophosphoryl diester phosphodiesterase
VAHRAGNSRAGLARAIAAGVDWVEADIWWHYGRLDARHEHAVWRLPLRYDEWKLGMALHRALRLPEICAQCAAGPRLLVDFKASSAPLAASVVSALEQGGALDRAAICGQQWDLLDSARACAPGLRVLYSIGSGQQISLLRNRSTMDPEIRAVSCAEALLTPALTRELLEREIEMFAWTVNDRDRAVELVEMGVAGIISDNYEVLRDLTPALS